MQIQLSKLLQLALGRPHYLNCDQFTLLHTLLHVLLEKLKMSDSEVELEGEFGDKTQKLSQLFPDDHFIKIKEVCHENLILVQKIKNWHFSLRSKLMEAGCVRREEKKFQHENR